MKIFKAILFFVCAISFPIAAVGEKLSETAQSMIEDLAIIRNTLKVKYAPAEWKKTHLNWDLEEEFNKAINAIISLENPTVKEYQQIVKRFLNSTCDQHVGLYCCSTESSYLPFRITNADGRYFIAAVEKKLTKAEPNLFKVGDEVLAFDGTPVSEVVDALLQEECGSYETATNRAFATRFLTVRVGSLGHIVPSGPVKMVVQSKQTKQTVEYEMEWIYSPERVVSHYRGCMNGEGYKSTFIPLEQREMATPLYRHLEQLLKRKSDEADAVLVMGAKKSFVPELGKVLWRSKESSYFHSYIYRNKRGDHIGYLRIPSYYWESLEVYQELQKHIAYLQKNTDALVIDEVNNPGGEASYLYSILSMLTHYPLETITHQFSITQEDVLYSIKLQDALETISNDKEAKELMKDALYGDMQINFEFAKNLLEFHRFIINEWNAGKTITDTAHVFGLSAIAPHKSVRYTKPILVLTNELSVSAADYLPAILQDNGRAAIFGTKTAGASGAAADTSHPNLFGIDSYTYAKTIGIRKNRDPLENLGVTPDIPYEITAEDVQGGYKGYRDAVNAAVSSLLKNR